MCVKALTSVRVDDLEAVRVDDCLEAVLVVDGVDDLEAVRREVQEVGHPEAPEVQNLQQIQWFLTALRPLLYPVNRE